MENKVVRFKSGDFIKYNGIYYFIRRVDINGYHVNSLGKDDDSTTFIGFLAPIQEVEDYQIECYINNNWDDISPIKRDTIDTMVETYIDSFSNILCKNPKKSDLVNAMADAYRDGIVAACLEIEFSA